MMTVHEVSQISGVSIRSLHHYDRIGLLPATEVAPNGYRLYDEAALERLQHILFFKELAFSLREIRQILDSPSFDRDQALAQQIALLELQREHLDGLLGLAREIQKIGVRKMDFSAFDTKKMEDYAAQAKAAWGNTSEYKEYEEKSKERSPQENQKLGMQLMQFFTELGALKDGSPDDPGAQALVKGIQDFITEHYYTCSDEVFLSLGQGYAAGGAMTKNIDRAGGEGTAAFAKQAIEIYCRNKQEG
ncbi:MAG: MerR family transcriptional regulator [Lachnospiraceae bacterium]|nr:MerR family transcriptional regulator [Lachnospiraceae bacterium]